jgi:SHS family lactate transporter-like MFS transporter
LSTQVGIFTKTLFYKNTKGGVMDDKMAVQSRSEKEMLRMNDAYTPKERSIILIFAFLATLFDGTDFFIFTYFMSPLSALFGVSLVDTVFIQSTSYVAGIVGGIIFGVLADKKGRRIGLGLSVIAYSVFTFLSGYADSYTSMLICRVLAGIGIGGESGIAFAYLNELYSAGESKRGTMAGLMQTMFLVGGILAAWVYGMTSRAYLDNAWAWSFRYLGGSIVLGILIFVCMPESKLWLKFKHSNLFTQKKVMPLVELFKKDLLSITIKATVVWTALFFAAYSIITFGPSMLRDSYSLSATTIANIQMAVQVLVVLGYAFNGVLSDLIGRRLAMVVPAIVATVAYGAFFWIGAFNNMPIEETALFTSLPFICYIFMQLSYGNFGGQGAWLAELYPTYVRTTACNFIYYVGRGVGAGLGPFIALKVANAMGYDVRMAVAFGIIGSCLLFTAFLLPETRGKALN